MSPSRSVRGREQAQRSSQGMPEPQTRVLQRTPYERRPKRAPGPDPGVSGITPDTGELVLHRFRRRLVQNTRSPQRLKRQPFTRSPHVQLQREILCIPPRQNQRPSTPRDQLDAGRRLFVREDGKLMNAIAFEIIPLLRQQSPSQTTPRSRRSYGLAELRRLVHCVPALIDRPGCG